MTLPGLPPIPAVAMPVSPIPSGACPMRDTPNFDDANFALRLYELRREPEMRKARAMIGDLLDGADWETFQAVTQYGHAENAHWRQATSYWEIVASFVNRGIFHPDVYLDTCGEGIYTYCVVKPHLERLRATNPRALRQTERLVAEHPAIAERVALIEKGMADHRAREAAAASEAAAKAVKKGASKPATKKPAARAGARSRR